MVETKLHNLTYEDYLKTPDDERWELLNGELLMVASPNTAHQIVTGNLYWHLRAFVDKRGLGRVFVAPYDVVLSSHNVLQPDVLFIPEEQQSLITAENVKGSPALVVEVISPSSGARDREIKRRIYAQQGVGEYWLVDPVAYTLSVMVLQGEQFRQVGVYGPEDVLTSPALPGLALEGRDIFADV